MGCTPSSNAAPPVRHQTRDTVHPHNNRGGGRIAEENSTNVTELNATSTASTTNNDKPKMPDDNAIYGYDLYGDDDKTKGEQKDTTQNANQMQYDDAGFYGQTEGEKQDQALFDAGEAKPKEQGEEVQLAGTETETTTNGVVEEQAPPKEPEPEPEPPKEETQPEPKEEETQPEPKEEETQPEPKEEETQPEPKEEETQPEPKEEETQPEPKEEEKQTEQKEEEKQPEPEPEPALEILPEPQHELAVCEMELGDEEQNVVQQEVSGDGGYVSTTTGLMFLMVDFRSGPESNGSLPKPFTDKGEVWTDTKFTLHDAITDGTANTLTWKRTTEISSSPKLFSDGSTRYDIGQGGAGTCWFLSTVANISEHPEVLRQVIPDDAYCLPDTDEYNGVFHSRFWHFGQWDDVYIDDYLPVVHNTIPWGARSASDENEFWVSLLEKSFARYHGSYNNVYGGQPGDAYLALTGGVAERIDFDDNDEKPGKLYKRIHNAVQSGAHVTCTVPDKYNEVHGLVGGHAYSLTGTAKANKTCLLRVRNPWGNTEWTGPWSDKSDKWNGVSETAVPRAVIDDGEFWICLEDFLTYFDQTTICSLTPDFDMDGSTDSLNYVTNIYGEWAGETAAGFQKKLGNPRFLFTVPESETESPVVVQLIQKRLDRDTENFQVRCDLYKVLNDKKDRAILEEMGEKTNSYCPETQCSFRHRVSGGTYAIVPSCLDPGLEKSFLIRVFTSFPLSNIRELERTCTMMATEQRRSFTHQGNDYDLCYTRTEFGAFKSGVNCGGQVSERDTYATNPQYVLHVTEQTPVFINVMQEQREPRMAVGVRLYPSGDAPLDIETLYNLHDDAVTDTDGTQYKFIQTWDMQTSYILQPGKYTLLLHLDKPGSDKEFALTLRSTKPVDCIPSRTC